MERVTTVEGPAQGSAEGEELYHLRLLALLHDLVREERMRELEVKMMQTHGMTLPPETYPLRGIARDSQLSWRRKALYDTRGYGGNSCPEAPPASGVVNNVNTFGNRVPGILPRPKGSLILISLSGFSEVF